MVKWKQIYLLVIVVITFFVGMRVQRAIILDRALEYKSIIDCYSQEDIEYIILGKSLKFERNGE